MYSKVISFIFSIIPTASADIANVAKSMTSSKAEKASPSFPNREDAGVDTFSSVISEALDPSTFE